MVCFRSLLLTAVLGAVALCAPWAAAQAQSHAFTVDDLLAMQRISSPAVSPDSQTVAFVLRTTDLDANRGRTDLWAVGADGKGLRQLTTHEASDFSPLWSADGRSLYFLSTRSGSSQVWRLPISGGEAKQVTDLPLDVANLVLDPSGGRLGFTLEVFPDCESLECTVERLAERQAAQTTGVVFERLFVRHWDVWKDGLRSHLFTVDLDPAGKSTGDPVDITRGFDADTPSKPFGGAEEIVFSPEGKAVVFVARVAGEGEGWSTNFDLYTAPADGSEPPKNLTVANRAWDTHPVFSPDGSKLAYLAMERADYESDRFRLMVRDWPNGTPKVVAEAWDRSIGDFGFAADSGSVLATAADVGHRSLFRIDLAKDEVAKLAGGGSISSPGAAGERVVFARNHLTSPTELFSIAGDGGDVRQLTNINQERVSQTQMGDFEQFSFKGWNDETVYGFVVKPVDFDPAKKYPIAFLIHGGPQGSFSNNFHYRWNPQTYAGAGYAAVMIDFHGSVGYGQAFTDSIHNDWGGKPLEDLRKGFAAAVERYSFLDGNRACALGASYGGYMINWIAGNWPDGFRCLINHDGLFDHRSMYYTTEELWFVEWDHGGPYWKAAASHEKHNPANHVENWKTPMLVIHGALDYRVPETQGIATFTALQRRSIPSKFLYFPDENHWVLKAQNSIQWHQEVLEWMDRWLK